MSRIRMLLFIIFVSAASFSLNAQMRIREYKAIQFGISESRIPFDRSALALRFHYIGDGFIPHLNHQVGLNHSFFLSGGLNFHTFVYVNGGIGFSTRWFTLNGFVGPSLVADGYRSDPSESDAVGGSLRFGIGGNVSASVIFKPIKAVGIGIEGFANKSTAGSAWGTALVLHLSNTK